MASTAYQPFDSRQPERWDRPREEAERLGAALPPLLVEAERLTSGVWLGVHGRRKAGMGETFWQFRRYRVEDPATSVDWRQSAKSQHLFVREPSPPPRRHRRRRGAYRRTFPARETASRHRLPPIGG